MSKELVVRSGGEEHHSRANGEDQERLSRHLVGEDGLIHMSS
jgi:hypothetical protein